MADSLSNWLALREPADVVARSALLTHEIVDALGRHHPLSVLDLGAGTGSNVRYLAGRLPAPQRWLLVDRDPGASRGHARADVFVGRRPRVRRHD